MKINYIEAMNIAYAIQDYVKNHDDILNCNPANLLKIADYILNQNPPKNMTLIKEK